MPPKFDKHAKFEKVGINMTKNGEPTKINYTCYDIETAMTSPLKSYLQRYVD